MSAIPLRFKYCTLDSHPDQAATDAARAYLAGGAWSPPQGGRGAIIAGTVGSGKTGLAIAMLRWFGEYRSRTETAYVGTSDLLERLRPPADLSAMDRYLSAHVLVLDDLGAARLTEWGRERLYILANTRWEWCLPTIVTTNVGLDDLADHAGDRIVSRLQDGAEVIVLTGEDRRR